MCTYQQLEHERPLGLTQAVPPAGPRPQPCLGSSHLLPDKWHWCSPPTTVLPACPFQSVRMETYGGSQLEQLLTGRLHPPAHPKRGPWLCSPEVLFGFGGEEATSAEEPAECLGVAPCTPPSLHLSLLLLTSVTVPCDVEFCAPLPASSPALPCPPLPSPASSPALPCPCCHFLSSAFLDSSVPCCLWRSGACGGLWVSLSTGSGVEGLLGTAKSLQERALRLS